MAAIVEKADYLITVKLDSDQQGTHVIPNIPEVLYVGKTVQYSIFGNIEGAVTIEFTDLSPYRNADGSERTQIKSTDGSVKLEVTGDFPCRCFVTLPEKIENGIAVAPQVFGWGKNNPEAGGNHVVR